jgi:hypothetical protein
MTNPTRAALPEGYFSHRLAFRRGARPTSLHNESSGLAHEYRIDRIFVKRKNSIQAKATSYII